MELAKELFIQYTKLPKYLIDLTGIDSEVTLVQAKNKEQRWASYTFINSEISSSNLTGTPLEMDLTVNMSLAATKDNDEESYSPISLLQARKFINGINRSPDEVKKRPIVCICDGNDRKGTLALISSLSERFSRTLVFAGGCVLLSHIRSGIEAMLQCHNENLGIEFHKTESEVSSSYELYGSHLTEGDVNENTLTAGAFLLNCAWNVCQFDIPEQDFLQPLFDGH
ncbi:hypothetical protein FQA39_LY18800 [Lamprigera yunnana]|nr:hypothetical protein FQA39_LY18800 [Lamprigera yunnana]